MNKIEELFSAVSNDVFAQGTVGNCMWIYSDTSNDLACGVLSLASKNGFDRWANSRIVEISTTLWEPTDPDFKKFVQGVIDLF